MKTAVIGAGWAGLAAALQLLRQDHHVTVFEASHILGGRARRSPAPRLGMDIDNGQHILLGAYRETLALMRSMELDVDALFQRRPLTLAYADGSFTLSAARLPAPLHLLAGVLRAQGIAWHEKLGLIRIMTALRLRGWRTAPACAVAQWLARHRQSERMISLFWRPLCIAALNTPIELACAQLFANVLRDSLGGGADAADLLIPVVDLSSLWPDRLQAYADRMHRGRLTIRLGHPARRLESLARGVALDGEPYDALIVACQAPAALRLLKTLDDPPPRGSTDDGLRRETRQEYEAQLAALDHAPIATVTLKLARPWGLPLPMLGLQERPERLQFGQWLFDTQARLGHADAAGSDSPATRDAVRERAHQDARPAPPQNRLLHIVISDARMLERHHAQEVVGGVIDQVREQTQAYSPMPEILGHEVIVEKRATFIARPGLPRPANRTPWPRIMTAGDWTDTGYPAVLEGAVGSGLRAARELGAI